MTWDPRGKVAVVTGASSGIGDAVARRLAGVGMTVYAVARRTERLEALAGDHPTVVPHTADVTDQAAVDALAERVRSDHGACHALINNAGIGGGAFRGRDDLDDALRTIETNLHSVVRCMASFADLLEAGAPSRVVNVASVAGKLGIGPAAYAASKFGVVGFSEALSLSWRARGITVCQLNPGYIETEGFTQEQIKRSPAGRLVGQPDIVADAVADVLANGRTERTVPSFYRAFVTLRHLAPPLYFAVAKRMERASGTRE
ncbi:MAG: SDR family oxidoreductase [Actinobacteria bacterium]|jgi:NAD(P)-dependent dehydrogenase (short-subunit alcohol dehydrogenase family)|nr:SDR family oxidoreductase [Actinomycetota bacterium]